MRQKKRIAAGARSMSPHICGVSDILVSVQEITGAVSGREAGTPIAKLVFASGLIGDDAVIYLNRLNRTRPFHGDINEGANGYS